MSEKKLNIFITGARGFIGKNLVEYFSQFPSKYSLFYPYHKDLELTDADKVSAFIKKNKIDIIIHCASIGGSRKTGYDADKTDIVSTNLRMFFNLVRSMDTNMRMIYFGSGAEYDRQNYMPAMKEEYFGPHIPADDYGFYKYVCSKFTEQSKNILNLRIFGMFGKYEDYDFKFISNAIVKNLLKLPIVINQNIKFDYMYINDCVKIVERFISNPPKHNTYNLTTGSTIDLVTIANKINAISSFKSEVIVKNQGLGIEYSGSNSRLQKEISFKFTPFDNALKELFKYYASILPDIDKKAIEKDEYMKYCKTTKCDE
jgi:nucleoside-diphosphate-sugar epimerase